MKKTVMLLGAMICIAMFVGCGTTKEVSSAQKETTPTPDVPVAEEAEINQVTIIDWDGRTLGEVAAPTWLLNLYRGNADAFKNQYGVNAGRICKLSRANAKTEATAQALSRSGFAYSCASELGQKVIGRVGQGLNDMGQLEAVYMAASQTKVDMAGIREEATFWQKVRTVDADTKEKTDSYNFYTVYSMDASTWENLVKKYLLDIMGDANLETETQKKIGALFTEMKEDSDKKDEAKAKQEERDYQMQLERLAASKEVTKAELAADAASKIGSEADGYHATIIANNTLEALLQ